MLVFIAIFVWFAGESERRMVEAEAAPKPSGFDQHFSGIFDQFRTTQRGASAAAQPQRTPVSPRPSGSGAQEVEWEVLPPERGFRAHL